MRVPRPQILVTDGDITQDFYTPVSYIKGRTAHEALDIVTNGSTPLRALTAATVTRVIDKYTEGTLTGFGNEVWMYHETGIESRSCHMRAGITVKVGDKLEAGDQYGWTGRTGYRVPPTVFHVHHEEYWEGKRVDPLKSANQLTKEEMQKYDKYIEQTDPRLNNLEQEDRNMRSELDQIEAALAGQGVIIKKKVGKKRLGFLVRKIFKIQRRKYDKDS